VPSNYSATAIIEGDRIVAALVTDLQMGLCEQPAQA
jgi:hypothetical protein